MTQADGATPTAHEIRQQMRTLKPIMEAVEAALTQAARLTEKTTPTRRYEVLAQLSEAYVALDEALVESRVALGLPYERVLIASYTAIFAAD